MLDQILNKIAAGQMPSPAMHRNPGKASQAPQAAPPKGPNFMDNAKNFAYKHSKDNPWATAAGGAVAGAAGGGAIAKMFGGDPRMGALLGTIVGGGAGYYGNDQITDFLAPGSPESKAAPGGLDRLDGQANVNKQAALQDAYLQGALLKRAEIDPGLMSKILDFLETNPELSGTLIGAGIGGLSAQAFGNPDSIWDEVLGMGAGAALGNAGGQVYNYFDTPALLR